MSEWQPIETAPSHGEFLVTGYLFNDPEKGRWTCVANGSEDFPVDDRGDVLEYATHWMPLPEPPK